MRNLIIGHIGTNVAAYNPKINRRAYVQIWDMGIESTGVVVCDRGWEHLTREQFARFQRLQNALADAGRA